MTNTTGIPDYQLRRLAEPLIDIVAEFWKNPPPDAVARLAELDRLDAERAKKKEKPTS